MTELEVLSTNISEEKGTIKHPVPEIELTTNGITTDAHAGSWHRQVSLLAAESIAKFEKQTVREVKYGELAENITTKGLVLDQLHVFDRLIGDNIELEITQIGKKCHGDNCAIYNEVGTCIMPKEGIFARVIKGGMLKAGDKLKIVPKIIHCHIITLSDRAHKGEYKDKSGPYIEKLVGEFYKEKYPVKFLYTLIPDEADLLRKALEDKSSGEADLIFTTGGTGLGPRDITPEIVKELLTKEIPGIMEMIRVKYGLTIPAALLSRGVAGIKGDSLVFTLPGSMKAVKEYCDEILSVVDHAFLMLRGIGH